MKSLAPAIAIMFMAPAVQARDEAPPLPAWNAKERSDLEASGWLPGATLLTDAPIPGEPDQPAVEPLQLEAPRSEEIADDNKCFLPIPEKFLGAYFGARPKTFLIDPQGLLSADDQRERLAALDYHASDSSIDLFIYIIPGDQQIPDEVRKEEVPERLFSEKRPAVIIYYCFGDPQRSTMYLSHPLVGSVSALEQRNTLESAVMQALERAKPAEQLEKFLVQMSIRIYWIEQMLNGEPVVNAAPRTTVIEKRASAKAEKVRVAQEFVRKFAIPAGIILGSFLAALGVNRWLRWRTRYRFPECSVEPRLGGAHAAGIGAAISFASPALSPGSQRNQLPDQLRRP